MLAPKTGSTSQKLAELPSACSEQKIEVWSRSDEDGSTLLELVEYAWGSGLGWYVRKRVSLDAGQVEALRSLFAEPKPAAAPYRRSYPPVERDGNTVRLVFS
jgi:hypothetical protein